MNLPGNRMLPIWSVEQAFLDALKRYQVVIVSAETGSGKTTQLSQILFEAGYAESGMIGVSQPRRVAAASSARRIAFERGVKTGQEVGFQVRFDDQVSFSTKIKLATEGIFLQEAKNSPDFQKYSVLMLDEFHERSLDIDMLLGLAKLTLTKRPDFRLVISSATIRTDDLVAFFGTDAATVIECDGRTFPVEHIFEEVSPYNSFSDGRWGAERCGMAEFVANKAASLIDDGERGDILVFLAGIDDLERAKKHFDRLNSSVQTLLAYGEMPLEELEDMLNPSSHQRVFFATNVAETSLTIPDVTVVINSGQVKKDFCDAVTGIVNIKLIDTSKASDMQRAGRAGRVQPGVCYHCFTKQDYNKHSDYDVPAIQRANLSQALMVMASVGISDFENFPLLNKPDSKQVESAKKALVSIGALDSLMALTDYGQQIADFPLIPELAHLLVQAAKEDAVVEMATFLAMIESRPIPKKSKDGIPKYLSVTGDCKSDPEVYLKLWQEYHEANFSWDWAKDQGLNPKRMQEARDVRGQLLQIASEQGLPIDSTKDGFSKLKRALLKARPDQICIQGMSHDYQSLMGKLEDIYIHPSSVTFSGFSSPRLLWYFKAQTTTKLYAHSCMAVNPDELQEFFPEKVETVTKYSPSLFSNNLRIHEEVTFEGRILEQGSSEEREMSPEECDLFSSPGVNRYRSFTSEEIKGLMERRRLTLLEQEEIRERLDKEQAKYLERRREEEAKFRQVQEKRYQVAQTLLTTLPEVPEDAWDLKVMAATIVSGLKSEYVNDRFLEEAPNRIADLQHFCEEHIRSSREYQEKLAFCQEYFEALVDDDLGKCPICYSVGIGQTNTCACVASMSDEQLGLSNGHREIDLISLQTEEGQILARIYIDRPITGLKSIRREVKDLTSLFKDLQVVKSKKD